MLLIAEDFLILLTFIIGFIRWPYLPLYFRFFIAQAFLVFIVECIGTWLALHNQNNIWLYNSFMVIDVTLTFLGMHLIVKENWLKRLNIFGYILFAGMWCFYVFKNGNKTFVSIPFLISCIFISITFLRILIRTMLSVEDSKSVQWLCLAMLIYYCCNTPVFAALNQLIIVNPLYADLLYYINNIFLVAHYILLIISITKIPRYAYQLKRK